MKVTAFKVFIGLIIILTASVSYADSGNELWKKWRVCNEDLASSDCYYLAGYVIGVTDVITCFYDIPDSVSIGQLCDIVGRYIDAHPESRHMIAASLIIEALKEAFPKK